MAAQINDNETVTLKEALQRFVEVYFRGQQPDIDEFVQQFPQHEVQLRKRIQDLKEIDTLFDSIFQAEGSEFEDEGYDLVGRKVGSFEITEIIGLGGMGVVYLAHDTRLKRPVAIKSIPAKLAADATARTRFRREAELLASLNHPNIAVIHDIIEQEESGYLVLEYVPGETLTERIIREPLKVEQALSIGRQIASAVSAAHKKGIVHRDLKPGNIKITHDGQVKVLDFGLAKPSTANIENAETTVTQRNRIMGTPAYMSPEQARGKETDHRTDLWSFGCIMYQMLTGKLPFDGKTATDTLTGIIECEPDWELLPKETPENIRILLHSCLEKDPDKRLDNIADVMMLIDDTLSKPLTASEPAASPRLKKFTMIVSAIVIVALSAVGIWLVLDKQAPSLNDEIRMVVLPFDNIGPTEGQWIADSMTGWIDSRLSGIYGLALIGRDSANLCKNRQMGTRQIAGELDVDYILNGTVQCENPIDPNSAFRIDLQLIETSGDTRIWGQTVDYNQSQLHQLQTQVAEQVAQQLDLLLLEQDRTWSDYIPTHSTEAHNLLLQGKAVGNYRDAIPLYEKAIEYDPDYITALCALAWAHTHIYWLDDTSPERLAKAGYYAHQAFALLPDHPHVRLIMARYCYQGLLDYESALQHLEKARELHPNHTWMLYWTHTVQQRQGNFAEALTNIKRAFELDPLSGHFANAVGRTYLFLREYKKAEHYYDLAIMRDPNRLSFYKDKAWLYLGQGDIGKAQEVMKKAMPNNKAMASNNSFLPIAIDIYNKDYEKALERIFSRSEDYENMSWFIPNDLWLAEVYGYMGKEDLEKQHYQTAVTILEKKLAEDPGHVRIHRIHSSLGKAYAGLGNELKAIEHGRRATELLPVERDALNGPLRLEDLARIYVMLGKHSEAIDILEDLLHDIPSELTTHLLELDPVWEPLRNHPRFKKLLGSDK
jgi:serine/threonine protein kinase/tetratricopeptide (TPR) repeat protein